MNRNIAMGIRRWRRGPVAALAARPRAVTQRLSGYLFFDRDDLRRGTFAPFSRASLRHDRDGLLAALHRCPEPLLSVPFFSGASRLHALAGGFAVFSHACR
jgi:hypothetical protein